MIYAALLRGINVGGNNKISMKELKKAFEEAGMDSVSTYINSGNIIFTDDNHTKEELSHILHQAIDQAFSLDIKVLVLSLYDFQPIMGKLPDTWKNDDEMKCDVLFLRDELEGSEELRKALVIKDEIDRVIEVEGAVIWSADRKNVTKSGLMKLAGNPAYKKMTIRNVNTVRKLYQLMKDLEQTV